MTGTDRSNLSCRTLLFLFVLLGTPMAARSDTLEDSARELARKIAAALPTKNGVSVDVRNLSSLLPIEVARIEQTLKTELQNRDVRAPEGDNPALSVVVKLSENLKGFVWTAEIHQGDASRVVLATIPRFLENQTVSKGRQVVLRSEKFWEGPEPILDAAVFPVPGESEPSLFLLLPDSVMIRKKSADLSEKIEIPTAGTDSRDPKGHFSAPRDDTVGVDLAQRTCTIDLKAPRVANCLLRVPPDIGKLIPYAPTPAHAGSQIAFVQSGCGPDGQLLAAGVGDYTQMDSIQAFEVKNAAADPVSDELNYSGPVLALHEVAGGQTATAIVRNLKSGNYEAYRLSISCGQ